MELQFTPRLNLITGDNGLGKTFLLDAAWYALTGTWSDKEPLPRQHGLGTPTIQFGWSRAGSEHVFKLNAVFDRNKSQWNALQDPALQPARPAVVLYARVDGGFSIFDRLKNSPQSAYHFTVDDVWNGLKIEEKVACNGLLQDWIVWQISDAETFSRLSKALSTLSRHSGLELTIGKPARVSLDDVRDIPTVNLPYGTVPLTHTSAAVKRVASLAYLLVWAWDEHYRAAAFKGQEAGRDLVLLFDEVETHLHPRWQRSLLPALLAVVNDLRKEGEAREPSVTMP